MKKLIASTSLALAFVVTGCKTMPSTDEMYKVGSSVGYTTAYVLNNQVKLDSKTRETIRDIVEQCETYIPTTNETFTAKWTPIMEKYVKELLDNEDINVKQAATIRKYFGYVVSLLDNYVDKKGFRPYQDVTNAFIYGFCDTFLKNFNDTTRFSSSDVEYENLDEFTVGYLSRCLNK